MAQFAKSGPSATPPPPPGPEPSPDMGIVEGTEFPLLGTGSRGVILPHGQEEDNTEGTPVGLPPSAVTFPSLDLALDRLPPLTFTDSPRDTTPLVSPPPYVSQRSEAAEPSWSWAPHQSGSPEGPTSKRQMPSPASTALEPATPKRVSHGPQTVDCSWQACSPDQTEASTTRHRYVPDCRHQGQEEEEETHDQQGTPRNGVHTGPTEVPPPPKTRNPPHPRKMRAGNGRTVYNPFWVSSTPSNASSSVRCGS